MRATAVRLVLSEPREFVAVVEYGRGEAVPVRWQAWRAQPWRCTRCGRQPRPTCPHAVAVDHAVKAARALAGSTPGLDTGGVDR